MSERLRNAQIFLDKLALAVNTEKTVKNFLNLLCSDIVPTIGVGPTSFGFEKMSGTVGLTWQHPEYGYLNIEFFKNGNLELYYELGEGQTKISLLAVTPND